MRRILAITLLIAFGSPFVLPLLASTPDAQAALPACCRRNGAHHCNSTMATGTSGTPAFKAPSCPFYPSHSTAPGQSASLLPQQAPGFALLPVLVRLANGECCAHELVSRSNPDRGPPALPA